jgi:hypothetical protein
MKFQLPRIGDKKTKRTFCWLPTIVGDLDGGVYVWLGFVTTTYVYQSRYQESPSWHVHSRSLV